MGVGRQALQPAPYPRVVAAIDVPELALEIGFLAGDHTVADHKCEGYQRHQQPEAVEGNGQADEPQYHAKIDGVAREAVRASLHDGRGLQAGGHFEPARVIVEIAHATSASARANTIMPSQPVGTVAGKNGKSMSQLSASPGSTASAHAIGGRTMTFAVSAVSAMTGPVNLRSFRCGPATPRTTGAKDVSGRLSGSSAAKARQADRCSART